MPRSKSHFLYLFIGLLFGIFVTIIVKKIYAFEVDNKVSIELNPLEIITLIVNSLLALYLATTITKVGSNEKAIKDQYISLINTFNFDLRTRISTMLQNEEYGTIVANCNFKILRSNLNSILLSCEKKGVIDITNLDYSSLKIKDKLTELWNLFTDIEKKPDGRSSSKTKTDYVNKILEKNLQIEIKLNDLSLKINDLICIISSK